MPRSALRCVARIVVLIASAAFATGAYAASPSDGRPLDLTKYIAVSEIHPGQVATCRTVFAGRTIETFELDVVGVLPGGRTDGDLILARARGERLAHDGIAAGMSGSPIYIDGRLAGALAYSWSFSRDPLCGITPIAEMLDVLDHPEETPAGDFGGTALPRAATGPATEGASLTRLRTPIVVSGLTPEARAVLEPWATEQGFVLAPGGTFRGAGTATRSRDGSSSASPDVVPRLNAAAARVALEPGAAIAVDLVRGDMNASAIGTLTWRDGDRVLAFGHPFFQSGPVRMPLALADITTIVASDLNSFKMGVPAEQVGAITQDRRAGIGGGIGAIPTMLPVVVRVRGNGAAESYHFGVLRHRLLAPQLVSVLALNAVTARGGLMAEATWHYRFAMTAPGHAPVVLEDVGSGSLGSFAGSLTQPLQLLLNNPFAPYLADSLTLDLDVTPELSRTQVWSARLEPKVARPGDRVRLFVETHDYRGDAHENALELTVPADQAEGRLVVVAGAGPELDRSEASRLPTRHRANSLDELVLHLGDRRKASRLYGAIYGPGVELNLGGQTYPELPAFAQQLLASDRAVRPSDPWGRLDRIAETDRAFDAPLSGLVFLTLEVRNRPRERAVLRGSNPTAAPTRLMDSDSQEDTE